MKRIFISLLAILLLISLLSCSVPIPISVSPQESKTRASATEDAKTTADKTTEPVVPAETAEHLPEPVVPLNCFDKDCYLSNVCPVDKTRALVQYFVPNGQMEYASEVTYYLALIDTEADVLLRDIPFENGDEYLLGVRENGEVLFENYAESCVSVYNADLTFDRALALPEKHYTVVFDRRSDSLYSHSQNEIAKIAWDGTATCFSIPGVGIYVEAYDPASGLALLECPDANDVTGQKITLYDTDGQRFLKDYSYIASAHYMIYDGKPAFMANCPSEDPEAEYGWEQSYIALFDENADPARYLNLGRTYTLTLEDGISYAAGRRYDYTSDGEEILRPVLFDLDGARSTVPTLEDDGFIDVEFCFFTETGFCLLSAVSEFGPESYAGHARLYMIDPSLLTFEETLQPMEAPVEEERQIWEVGDDLASIRNAADYIQKYYSITILLGNECLNAAPTSSYGIITTEDESISDGRLKEIEESLVHLYKALSPFPSGFFRQFQGPCGEGGIRIMLVSDLTSIYYTNFTAGGLFYRFGAWYNIIFDVDMLTDAYSFGTVEHELWHAVEERISLSCPEAFSSETWNKELLPAGFEYIQDFDTYLDENWKWSRYILYWGDDPYFAESYSLVTPYEDRSTLVESLYNGTFEITPAESCAALQNYPHMKAKLDYMAQYVRQIFGSVYWETDDQRFSMR